ncbi:hypothetical protein HF289_16485 [Acidithiobacillus ferrooxidans]|uniref:8-oxoguanine DNA glycosylase OGG fold protein n=1 Tax=Acidithiobacillus ferrooxidans TaxID=920 RepID=UPI0013D83E33|nr:hypothetical protein [Acidithiobacillus ferrooxidans]MBU2858386.1 hypothetical protein [Acidithiobacillus ferrooxidans]MBU2861935.1 hypothetical protein [Acidithiobacillus ferrooxidans]MCR2831778.1 hypothetical protein [Acidithiobacillus ferrooxidans]
MSCPRFPSQQMQTQRNAYAYPTVALGGALGNFTVENFPGTQTLDQYLNELLSSPSDESRVLGYLSVIFWGHYSGQDGRIRQERAFGKVGLAYNGQNRVVRDRPQRMRGVLDIGVGVAAGYISTAANHIQNNEFAYALATLSRLPQLQIAFASKVCAFINPQQCGVIDSVIAENHPRFGFTLVNGYVQNNVQNRNRYGHYCAFLQETAKELNADLQFSSWTDRDHNQHEWRAVDVERALY